MKVDLMLGKEPGDVRARVLAAAAAGYSGICSAEAAHDPFVPLVVAALTADDLDLQTQVAVAFARNPLSLAAVANDLQAMSRGRLILGLGSQIRAHIENRFSMPWSRPAARMREIVLAMRAIWAAWNEDAALDFRGEFYRHTLMTPNFTPPPNPYGPPRVLLAAVGPEMTTVAGEVADGLVVHPLTTPAYFREVTLPAFATGVERAGRRRADYQIAASVMIVTAGTDAELAAARWATRKHIAFYGSVPAYRPVLELAGHGDLQPVLNAMSKRGEWDAMADLIPDSFLEAVAVVGSPDELAAGIAGRFGDAVNRVTLFSAGRVDDETLHTVVGSLTSGQMRRQMRRTRSMAEVARTVVEGTR